jgi:hypothetical protein
MMTRFKVTGYTNSLGIQSAPMHTKPTKWDKLAEEGARLEHSTHEIMTDFYTTHQAILKAWDFAVKNELQDEHHKIIVKVKHPLCPTQEYFYKSEHNFGEDVKPNEDFRGAVLTWHIDASDLFRQKPYHKSFGDLMKEDFQKASQESDVRYFSSNSSRMLSSNIW